MVFISAVLFVGGLSACGESLSDSNNGEPQTEAPGGGKADCADGDDDDGVYENRCGPSRDSGEREPTKEEINRERNILEFANTVSACYLSAKGDVLYTDVRYFIAKRNGPDGILGTDDDWTVEENWYLSSRSKTNNIMSDNFEKAFRAWKENPNTPFKNTRPVKSSGEFMGGALIDCEYEQDPGFADNVDKMIFFSNTSDAEAIAEVEGVSEAAAEDLVEEREANGKFESRERIVDSLDEDSLYEFRHYIAKADITVANDSDLLEFVNRASMATLDQEVSIDVRAAKNIVQYRNGEDGVVGTEDDNKFESIDDLLSIDYVGDTTVDKIRSYISNS
jgi:DNA uptake protein ComE-like DNA-binding protein